MLGESLYMMYEIASSDLGVDVDPWTTLDADARAPWIAVGANVAPTSSGEQILGMVDDWQGNEEDGK